MRRTRVSIAVVTALLCAHAAAAQDSRDSKEAPARNPRGLSQFESAVLSGNQTKSSAYRRASAAKDPVALPSARESKPGGKPNAPPRRKAADKAKGG